MKGQESCCHITHHRLQLTLLYETPLFLNVFLTTLSQGMSHWPRHFILYPDLFLVCLVSLVTVLRAARVISCPSENSLLYSVQTIGFCLSLSSKPFILQTHIGMCSRLPLRAGQWLLWTRNIQESVINIPVTCANLWLFHLLRGAVSFLPRNLIQPWFSK